MAHLTEYLTSVSRHRLPGGSAGQRALALLLSAMLVLGAVSPGAALAAEADSEGEGSAPPEQVAEPGEEPDFEPGGEETVLEELPAVAGAELGGDAEGTGEGSPVEVEPPEDTEAPPPPVEATSAAPDDTLEGEKSEAAEPPAEEAVAAPEPEAEPEAVPPEVEPEVAAAATEPVENQTLVAPPSPPAERAAQSSAPSEVRVSAESSPPAVPPNEGEAPQPPSGTTAPELERGDGALADRRSHTVRPGESLWAIAEAVLPPGAGDSELAREVQRLWQLNESRIGTGDPDMLPVGVELRLR